MSVTVLDCLKLPSLREGTVISGHSGLNQIVNNISVLEITDLSFVKRDNSINNFEISLTSFAGVTDDVNAQCELIRHLSGIGDVGLIIYYYGIIMKEISEDLKKVSDELGFPIVLMPKDRLDFKYSEAIRDVSELILSHHAKERNIHGTISSSLSKLPKGKRTFSNILTIISDIIRANILISDMSGEKRLQSSWPISNPINFSTIIELFSANAKEGDEHVVVRYLDKYTNIYSIALTTAKFRHYRLYIFDEFQLISLQDARQIADLIQLFSEIWDIDDEIFNFNVISAILDGDTEGINKFSKVQGVDFKKFNSLLCINADINYKDINKSLLLRETMEGNIKSAAKRNLMASFFCKYECYYFVFFDTLGMPFLSHTFICELSDILPKDSYTSFVLPSDLSELGQAFRLYEAHGDNAKIIFKRGIITYTDLLFTRSCFEMMKSNGETVASFEKSLSKIADCPDAEELITTLCTYFLDTNCRVDLTAKQLYIHRNTVKYRIDKVFRLLCIDPDSPSNLFYMQSLLAYYRLNSK